MTRRSARIDGTDGTADRADPINCAIEEVLMGLTEAVAKFVSTTSKEFSGRFVA